MRYLVDASIAVKWFVPEDYSDAADAILASEHELCAPDFILVEAANVFWKKVQSDQMTAAKADEALLALTTGPVELLPTPPLLPRALEMANRIGHPVYDCLYAAAAESRPAVLMTADRRLAKAMEHGDWNAKHATLYQ